MTSEEDILLKTIIDVILQSFELLNAKVASNSDFDTILTFDILFKVFEICLGK